MRIAIVIAHPDYLATKVSGTVLRHAAAGDEIHALIVSAGDLGPGTILYPGMSADDILGLRTKQFDDLKEVINGLQVTSLTHPDAQIQNTPALRLDIATWLRQVRPEVLITHWVNDAHPDVRATGQAALDACLISVLTPIDTGAPAHEVTKVYTFPIRTSIDFAHTTIVDISAVMPDKLAAVAALETVAAELQALCGAPDDPNGWHEKVLGPDLYWGERGGVRYGEPFALAHQPEGRSATSGLAV